MRTFRCVLTCLCCTAAFISAEEGVDAPGYRATYPPQVVELSQLSVAPAKTRKGHFSYGETNALINTNISSKKVFENSFIAGLRNIHQSLGAKIRSRNTLYGVVGLNSKYSGIQDWLWNGSFVIEPDLRSSSLARTTRYIGALHGRYEIAQSTGLHAGFYMELGMRASLVRPIIGVDYTQGPWLAQAVFPIKYGVSYLGVSKHMFSLMIRPFYTAVRIHKGLRYCPAITEYRGTGAELRWDYLPSSRWNFWVSLGNTMGGTLTIGDKNNNHRHHIHLHAAPYLNIGITYGVDTQTR